jgi:hypothetical protein
VRGAVTTSAAVATVRQRDGGAHEHDRAAAADGAAERAVD